MPRIRSLKPEIWMSPQVMNLSHGARLLFIGLITQADDEGRGTADARRLKAAIFGGDDVDSSSVRRWLDECSSNGLAVIYEVVEHGMLYELTSWKHHQRIDRPTKSAYPRPTKSDSSNARRALVEDSSSTQRALDEDSSGIGSLGSDGSERIGEDRIPTRAREPTDSTLTDAALHEAELQSAYPPFTGRQDWLTALHHVRRLIDEHGASWSELIEGVHRYAEYVRAGGASGPQYVLTPAKFFGDRDRPWAQPWTPPPTKADQRTRANVTAFDQVRSEVLAGKS